MANPGTGSAQGNELEQSGSFDASGQKIWINRATNDFIQMASGVMQFFIGGGLKFTVNSSGETANNSPITSTAGFVLNGQASGASNNFNVGVINLATTGGAATQTWTNAIPAGSLVLTFNARVSTVITGCTTFDIGYTGQLVAFGAGLAVASGTLANMSTYGAGFAAPTFFAATTNIVLTAHGGGVVFTTGAVRMTYSFISIADFNS